MTTDNKTLADVKPGGRVRLKDALPPLPPEVDAVRCMIRGEKDLAEACDYYYTAEQMRDYARAALSAQPSPGGQGDARLLADVDERIATAKALGYEDDIGVGIGLLQCVRSALAAQPSPGATALGLPIVVDPTVPPDTFEVRRPSPGGQGDASHYWPEVDRILVDAYVAGSEGDEFDMIAARTAIRAALAARQPVGKPLVTAEMLAAADKYHDSDEYRSGQFSDSHTNAACYRAMAAVAPPAQGVDLDAMHAAACAAWNKHQEACRITTVTGALRKVCEALLDIQAVGNGN